MDNKPMTSKEIIDRIKNPVWTKQQRVALNHLGKYQMALIRPLIKRTKEILNKNKINGMQVDKIWIEESEEI